MRRFSRIIVLVVAVFLMLSSSTVLGLIPPPATHIFLFSEEGAVDENPVFAKRVYEVYEGGSQLLSSSGANGVKRGSNIQIDLEIEPLKKEPQETFLLLLVDTSWSMTGVCEDGGSLSEHKDCRTKMEAAQQGLLAFLDSLEQVNLKRSPQKKIKVALLRYDTMIGYYSGEWKETYNNSQWTKEVSFTTQTNSLRQQINRIAEDRLAEGKCARTAMGWGLSEGLKLFKEKVKKNSAKKVIINFTDGHQYQENIFYILNPKPGQESDCYLNKDNPKYACTEEWDFERYLKDPSRRPRYDCDTHHPAANSLELIQALKDSGIVVHDIGYGKGADGSPPKGHDSITSIDPSRNCPSSVCPGSVDGRGGDRSAVFEVRQRSGVQYSLIKTDLPLPGMTRFNLLNALAFETGGMYYYIPPGSQKIESIFQQILEALSGTAGIKIVERFSSSLLAYKEVEAFAGGVQIVPDSVNVASDQVEIVFPEDAVFDILNLKIYFTVKEDALGSGCVDCSVSQLEWFVSRGNDTEVLFQSPLPQYQLVISSSVSGRGDVYLESQDLPLTADLVVLSANTDFSYPRGVLALLRDYDFEEDSFSASQRFQRELSGLVDYFLKEEPEGINVIYDLESVMLRSGRLYILDARDTARKEFVLSPALARAVCEESFALLVWGGNVVLPSDISCLRGVVVVLPYHGVGGEFKAQSSLNLLGTLIAKKIEGTVNIQGRDEEIYWRNTPGLAPLLEKIYYFYQPND